MMFLVIEICGRKANAAIRIRGGGAACGVVGQTFLSAGLGDFPVARLWDGAPRRPRRVQRRNTLNLTRPVCRLRSARYYAGGDIAALCPYPSTRAPIDFRDAFRYDMTMRSVQNIISRLVLGLLSIQCGAAIAADAPAKFKAGEFTFARPGAWEWVEVNSSMRKAQLKITDEKTKNSAEVIFFHFGAGQGGDTKQNLDRWFGQFQEPREKIEAKTDEVTVGKRKITYAHAQGTYSSGMPGGPKTPLKDHALLGAIVESDQGNVFIRMTGPLDLVKRSTGDFKKMVEGALK
jgi:hypothetical protein